jgi:hypothetical protein
MLEVGAAIGRVAAPARSKLPRRRPRLFVAAETGSLLVRSAIPTDHRR